MNRRSFIAGIGAAVGAAVLDPERALWVPGARLFSIPAPAILVDRVLRYDALTHIIEEHFIARRGDGEVCGMHFEVVPMMFHPAAPRREVAQIQLARMLKTSPARVDIPEARWWWDELKPAAVVPVDFSGRAATQRAIDRLQAALARREERRA